MEQSRYRDKAYLVTYELTTDIFDQFNLKVDDIIPIRAEYILFTDTGDKLLKKISYGFDELEFIHSVLLLVQNNGFKNIIGFSNTADGNYYIKRDDGVYVVLDLVPGRYADFHNPDDIREASKALCNFHKATEGIIPGLEKRSNLYKWIPAFEKRIHELIKFREIAELHEIKTGFDRLFLRYIDKYCDDAVRSVNLLNTSAYRELCDNISKCGNICHHNLAFYNIIIGDNGNVYFVDLDSCVADLRVHDIGNLIMKCVKNCNWDIEMSKIILDSYCSVDMLSSQELEVLYDFLVFPQDFYDICRNYYMKTKSWDEDDFLAKLTVKTDCCSERKAFLEKFKIMIQKGAV